MNARPQPSTHSAGEDASSCPVVVIADIPVLDTPAADHGADMDVLDIPILTQLAPGPGLAPAADL